MATGQFGFMPVHNLGSGGCSNALTMRVGAGANNAFAIGDPVQINAGKVIPVTAATSANECVGVIVGLKTIVSADGNKPKPMTFNQPTRGPYLVSGADGYAMVIVNPDQLYIAQIDVSASIGLIGKNTNVSAGTPNALSGRSTYNLSGAQVSAAASYQFKIVGIAPTELLAGYGIDLAAGSGVLVKLNDPLFRSGASAA